MLFVWYKRSKGILEGGGQGSKKNYDLCRRVLGEENVDSFYIHDEYKKKSLWDYLKAVVFFPLGYYYGVTPATLRALEAVADRYDYIWVDRSIFGVIAKHLREKGYQGKIMVFFHNVEKVYFDEAKLPKRLPLRNVVLRCVEKNERWSMRYADTVLALNERDDATLGELYGRKADALISVAMEDRFVPQDEQAMTSKRLRCLTIGAYFAPNNEGILWFVQHVLPNVDVEYKIVGKGMGRLQLEHPDLLGEIEVVSDAPDLAPYFYEADCMILPIFSGSGMKVKTCESLMQGRNILGTTEAFEGYEVDYDKVGALCNTADEFVNAIRRMETTPVPKVNPYSREVFTKHYSEQSQLLIFEKLFHTKV